MSHETRIISQKTNKKNYKTQFPTNKILNDGFEKKRLVKITIKIMRTKFDIKKV